MSKVRGKNTTPELAVRKLVFSLGYRYRLHAKNLPGKPDLVFPGRKKAIFVHGCFWHSHDCKFGHPPSSRQDYWLPKLEANRRRDSQKSEELIKLGWKVLVIWQCEIKDTVKLAQTIVDFLNSGNNLLPSTELKQ